MFLNNRQYASDYENLIKKSFRKEINNVEQINEKLKLSELSMGMSNDYLKAIEYSSTYLRIGSQIFGERF